MSEKRDLTPDERGVLLRMLSGASFPGSAELAAQVVNTSVVGGIPTLLDLEVARPAPAAACPDGPVPLRGWVQGPEGDEGVIIVWVKDGYLDGLEFGWFTDDPPTAFPPPERLRIAAL